MDPAEWDRLMADIRSFDDFERMVEASLAIREWSDRSRLPELKLLIQDDDFYVRESAADALCRLEGLKSLPLLLEALERGTREGHDNDGLAFAIVELIESDKAASAPLLLEMLRSPRAETRAHAAWLLGFVSDAISPDPLLKALSDPNPDVRLKAVGASDSFHRHPGVLEAILPLVKQTEEQVRVNVVAALGSFKDDRAISALRDALSDPSARVRSFAVYSLGRLGVESK
ncbi:MAG: hypothetical protein NVSMB14_00700 [Isosphaeraceae bacterium]